MEENLQEDQNDQQTPFQHIDEQKVIENVFEQKIKLRVDYLQRQSKKQNDILQNLSETIIQLRQKAEQINTQTQLSKSFSVQQSGQFTPRQMNTKLERQTSKDKLKEVDRQETIKEKQLEKQKKEEELKKKKEEERKSKEEVKKKQEEERRIKLEKQKEERKKQEDEKKQKQAQQAEQKRQQLEQQKRENEQKKKEIEERKAQLKKEQEMKIQKQKEAEQQKKEDIKQKLVTSPSTDTFTQSEQIQSKSSPKSAQAIPISPKSQNIQAVPTSPKSEAKTIQIQEVSESLEVKKARYEQLKSQLVELEASNPSEIHQVTQFKIGVGAKNAIELISSCQAEDLYNQPCPDEITEICFKLYFILIDLEIQNPFWPQVQEYLKTNEVMLGQVILDAADNFNFSEENIKKIKEIMAGNTVSQVLDPGLCNVPITGFLMFPLKEATEFAGFVPKKCPVWREYENLKSQMRQLESEIEGK